MPPAARVVDQPARIAFTGLASLHGLTPTEARAMTAALANAELIPLG